MPDSTAYAASQKSKFLILGERKGHAIKRPPVPACTWCTCYHLTLTLFDHFGTNKVEIRAIVRGKNARAYGAGSAAMTGQLTGTAGALGIKLAAVLAALIRVSSERWA